MSTFSIIHDLDVLNNEQIAEYVRAVSEHFGLPPELNAFDVIYMDAGDGRRKKVVYARKGTTDILRDKNGIEVSSLTQHDGAGYVSFTATGKNKSGRQEIAVGAHNIEGLKGQKLADAVMTAQTRALRRLTLQFVGGGILDVSEVGTTVDINTSQSSLAQLAGSPAVIPPLTSPIVPSPGKDVTERPGMPSAADLDAVVAEQEVVKATESQVIENEPVKEPEVVNSSERVVNLPPLEGVKKRRTNKRRNTVDLRSPGQETTPPTQIEMPVGEIDAKGEITPVSPSVDIPQSQQAATSAPVISSDKKTEYKERLRKYTQKILPDAGLLPSEGFGVTAKLREFSKTITGRDEEEKLLNLLTFLDDYVKQYGAPVLVQHIDKTIGVVTG